MKAIFVFAGFLYAATAVQAQCQRPPIGTKAVSTDSALTITLIDKKQQYSSEERNTWDTCINSPKSVNIHPDGKKFYVNSLEGATTISYNFETKQRVAEIHHRFNEQKDAKLWAKPSGLFAWEHYFEHQNTFFGKPVESTFSHNGRYLWVPYYRRSFDINAQDPSAVAIIDTQTDKIIRLMETGPLPKMIATSPDGKLIAIAHWGNNTVGLINIASDNPKDWKYECVLVVDHQLKLDFPLDISVDRDNGSGYALRGTVFTPDNKYLFVGCMGGGGGIAIIDIPTRKYLGRILGMADNVRHLMLSNGYLYLSINGAGLVQRTKLATFIDAIGTINNKVGHLNNWETCAVGKGARTIACTPNGRYIFAACNQASQLYIVDTKTFKVIGSITADSYPVGLDVSSDGRYVFTTSQGRNGQGGGNAVDIFEVEYKEAQNDMHCMNCGTLIGGPNDECSNCGFQLIKDTKIADEIIAPAPTTTPTAASKPTVAHESQPIIIYIICGALLLITAIFLLLKCRKRPNMV